MTHKSSQKVDQVTILFAGDSGDGIQLTGSQFSENTALYGNDLSTFPDFPAEIRAPQGTVSGVSGFQIHFGSIEIFNSGDIADVLVAFNAAALKKNIDRLKKRGILICNTAGFDKKNLRLSEYETSPITDELREAYQVIEIDITKITREALDGFDLSTKDKDRSKNMFVLGFIYWLYNRDLKNTVNFLETKFAKKPVIAESNIKVLKAGYYYGDTVEAIANTYEVNPAKMASGEYRNVMGNQATALGLIAASVKSGLDLFYGGYPITPASDVLHELSKHKNFGIRTFQAEDEIAGICTAIGAAYGGALATTASSGPGIALKGEALGLVHMLELPMVIVNVQRGGPSTGLPTKTEQADLNQAVYGRNGEAPIPIIAAQSPSDCFDAAFQACKIAIEHMTPVMLLTDGYIANGSEPWMFPQTKDLEDIKPPMVSEDQKGQYLPYERDENLVRKWAIPGMEGFEHRVGGLEKDALTGAVSYDSFNHQSMIKTRKEKVDKIKDFIPLQTFETGSEKDDILLVSWGSTFGSIKSALKSEEGQKLSVAHIHLRNLLPFPKNLGELLSHFDKIIVPELNNGQLIHLLRAEYLVDAQGLNKIKGIPFEVQEILSAIKEHLN
ncbi:MAG: 2-oxoacid:acceptor oxidoreductase subunit alpha [Flavobacteriales bacterium]|jgi:2-oxoglutarate ferredoxin oxidoreductase subunit alpha|nr:2-oxoacid:acceptor oxidoreductase subunit alpha [Flavobacteriales bacterium]